MYYTTTCRLSFAIRKGGAISDANQLPRTARARRRRWRRHIGCCHHGRGHHHRCWGNHGRRCHHGCGCHHGRGAYDVVHDRSRAKDRSDNSPSMMVMGVVRTMSMAAHGGRCAVASPRAAVGSRARSRKHNSSRCHGRHHYYQFLVHVYLLFLSLSTLSKARTAEKPDKSFQKNLRTAEGAVRGVSSQTAAALRTRLRERCRRRRSMSGHGSVPMPRCEHGRLRACWRRTSSRCRPHNP